MLKEGKDVFNVYVEQIAVLEKRQLILTMVASYLFELCYHIIGYPAINNEQNLYMINISNLLKYLYLKKQYAVCVLIF